MAVKARREMIAPQQQRQAVGRPAAATGKFWIFRRFDDPERAALVGGRDESEQQVGPVSSSGANPISSTYAEVGIGRR